MKRRALLVGAILTPFAVLAMAMASGLRINHTRSFPLGAYRTVSKLPSSGDLVFFRPPHHPVFELARCRGYLGPSSTDSQGAELLLKRIVAAAGDVVTIDAAGVTVNGRRIANSAPRQADLAGRSLPVLRLDAYRLAGDEVLLVSDYSPLSFDSRYFGPVPRERIQSVVVPVWTW